MRLSKMSRIRYGRENHKITPKNLRKDVIYKVYLGDRQIWTKKKNDEQEKIKEKKPRLDNKLRMVWHVHDYLVLANVTSATSITGTIDWGDGTVEEWQSGYNYYHKYMISGDYEVTLTCKRYITRLLSDGVSTVPRSTIGQIKSIDKLGVLLREQSYLKEIGFCIIPYLGYRLQEAIFNEVDLDNRKTMFEALPNTNTDKLESVKMLLDTPNTQYRMFYGTSLKSIVINGNVGELGYECFLRKNIDDPLFIRLEKDDVKTNTLTKEKLINSGIGYQIQGNGKSVIPNITVECPEEWTDIINYFTDLGATITYIEEDENTEEDNGN